MISAALADPITASQSGALNRLRMDVRTRNCRISAGWRLSTSSARKSVMNRLPPLNWPTKALGSGCPRSERAARYSPAGHPSVRSTSTAISERLSSAADIRCTNRAASAGEKRSSRARSSNISPTARNRAIGSGGSVRVISTTCADGGRCARKNVICSWQAGAVTAW